MKNRNYNINSVVFIVIAFLILSCKSTKKMSETAIENKNAENKTIAVTEPLNKTIVEPSFRLFKKLSEVKSNENISYSPLSLNMAFGMVYSGAANNTAKEISKALGYNENMSVFNKDFEKMFKTFKLIETDSLMQFNIANRIYFEQTFKLKDDYIKTVTNYGEDKILQKADFVKNAQKEEKAINDWISEFTKKRINNLIPDGTLDKNTKMVLVNALYFKSDWKFPFNEKNTKKDKFYSTAEQIEDKEFMTQHLKNGILYFKSQNAQVIELPYKTQNVSLIVILPDNSDMNNINAFIPNEKEYADICSNLSANDIYVEIPKFKTESSFELTGFLQQMGIKEAFGKSDFSGISEDNSLKISAVLQKIFFELNETGTEAAAATAIVVKTTSYNPNQKLPINFIANRPFIYILKDNNLNIPLFVGKFVK